MNRIFERALDKIKHFEKMFPGSQIKSVSFRLNKEDFQVMNLAINDQPVNLIQISQKKTPLEIHELSIDFNVNGIRITFIEDHEQLTF